MKFVRMLPPGSWCSNHAIKDIQKRHFPSSRTFIDVGCGLGDLSRLLLGKHLKGIGIDFCADAIAQASKNLSMEISSGRYQLKHSDINQVDHTFEQLDFGISNMVMEHIEDDVNFVRKCCDLVKPGGHFIFAVPSRKELWSLEDETVGHFRRYDRDSLKQTLERGGLQNPQIYSVAVPISNLLFKLSSFAIANSERKNKLSDLSKENQTMSSGIQEIPWKTVFPRWVKLFLNPITLYPLFVLQRLFYNTDLGVVMVAWGKVADTSNDLADPV